MSIFSSATNNRSNKALDVEELVEAIRRPPAETIKAIRAAREALKAGDEDQYRQKKTGLPAVTFSGVFSERKREKLETHSGLIGIDFDHLDENAIAAAKERLAADPHVVLFYVSPSGAGLKGAVAVDPPPIDAETHKVAFSAVRNYFARTHGLRVDEQCSDVSRLAFLSHDPECHDNLEAKKLAVEDWRDLSAEEAEIDRLQAILDAGIMQSIHDPIPPASLILSNDRGDTIGESGNIVTIEGVQKAGKTGVVSAILGAAICTTEDADFLSFRVPHREGFVVHFDCEQPAKNRQRLIVAALRRAGLSDVPPELKTFSLLNADVKDRWPACALAVDSLAEAGPVRLVIFDGGADLLSDTNNIEESNAMVDEMMRLAGRHSCLVVAVIHENPTTEGGKTRGHFGSQLWRKAQAAIAVQKGEDGISTAYAKFLRDGDWPKREGTFFKWDDEKKRHASTGDPSSVRAEVRSANKRQERQELAEKLFTGAAAMTHAHLTNLIGELTKREERTCRTYIKEMLEIGIIRKREDGCYERA